MNINDMSALCQDCRAERNDEVTDKPRFYVYFDEWDGLTMSKWLLSKNFKVHHTFRLVNLGDHLGIREFSESEVSFTKGRYSESARLCSANGRNYGLFSGHCFDLYCQNEVVCC